MEEQSKIIPKPESTPTNSKALQNSDAIEHDYRKDDKMSTGTTDPVNNDSLNEPKIVSTKENVAQPVLELPIAPAFHTLQNNPSVLPNNNNITTIITTKATVDNKKDDDDTQIVEEANNNNDVVSREEDVVNDSEDGPRFLDYGDDNINAEDALY